MFTIELDCVIIAVLFTNELAVPNPRYTPIGLIKLFDVLLPAKTLISAAAAE